MATTICGLVMGGLADSQNEYFVCMGMERQKMRLMSLIRSKRVHSFLAAAPSRPTPHTRCVDFGRQLRLLTRLPLSHYPVPIHALSVTHCKL